MIIWRCPHILSFVHHPSILNTHLYFEDLRGHPFASESWDIVSTLLCNVLVLVCNSPIGEHRYLDFGLS